MRKFLLAAVLAVSLASCGKGGGVVKYVGLKVYDPVYIAKDMGFFDGVDVRIVDTVAGGATAAQMVANGSVQGGLLSNMAIANAAGSGLPIIAVADIQSAFNDSPLEEFFVRNGEISSVAGLRGKKIAINLVKSSFHYTWIIALKDAGVSPEEVSFVQIPFPQQQEALERGMVDAIGLMQPYAKSARESDEIEMLFCATDVFGERQFCEIIMNRVWCESNAELAERFVGGIAKASEWAIEHQREAKEIISRHTGVPADFIDDYRFQPNARVDVSDAEWWLNYMQENEGVPRWVTVDDVATNRHNPKERGR